MLGSRPTGLGVYSENCIAGLAERFELSFIAGNGNLPHGEVLLRAPESIAIDKGKFVGLRRYLWTRKLSFPTDNLVYSPTHHGLPQQMGQIITVHDLIHLHLPSQHPQVYIYFRFFLPHLLKKCRAVFTVSEATRQDIAKSYGYPQERIFVVPNGVDTSAFKPLPTARLTNDPFLLMVGGRHPHKNVIEALDMAKYWRDSYRLVIASCDNGYYRRMLEKKVRDSGLTERVEFKGYLSHDELLNLYQRASALLYPSRIEGFGIPPLEALACGTPVIASDIPVFREVLGESAEFIKLGNPQSWAEAFQSLTNPSVVHNRIAAGQVLLSKMTWRNAVDTLEQTLLQIEPRLEKIRRQTFTHI
jgi:glycosyltransferase involved in cell wall biosynthesis